MLVGGSIPPTKLGEETSRARRVAIVDPANEERGHFAFSQAFEGLPTVLKVRSAYVIADSSRLKDQITTSKIGGVSIIRRYIGPNRIGRAYFCDYRRGLTKVLNHIFYADSKLAFIAGCRISIIHVGLDVIGDDVHEYVRALQSFVGGGCQIRLIPCGVSCAPGFHNAVQTSLSPFFRLTDSFESRPGGERGKEQRQYQATGLQPPDQNLPVRIARLIVSRFRSYGVATQITSFGAYTGLAWGLVGIGGLRWRGRWRGVSWICAGLALFLPLIWLSECGI